MTHTEAEILKDTLRSVGIGGKPLDEPTVARMVRVVTPVSQERLDGIAEVAFVAWRDAERQNISTWKWVAGEVALALGLSVSPTEPPAANQTRDDGASEDEEFPFGRPSQADEESQ